jgi:hypothetical protein
MFSKKSKKSKKSKRSKKSKKGGIDFNDKPTVIEYEKYLPDFHKIILNCSNFLSSNEDIIVEYKKNNDISSIKKIFFKVIFEKHILTIFSLLQNTLNNINTELNLEHYKPEMISIYYKYNQLFSDYPFFIPIEILLPS